MVAPTSPSDAVTKSAAWSDAPFIARGMGRSYGDSSLAPRVMSSNYLNLLLDFDPRTGVLRCEAGVTFADLLDVFVPKGWFLPVTPGTKHVTVGGAIANDVHGKNHHLAGCFSQYIESLRLLVASGEIIACSRTQCPDLFYATCGGIGLTGVILDATLTLKPIRSAFIERTTIKAKNLEEALGFFEAHHRSTYSVAWIDCLAKGAAMGRSLLMLGEHREDGDLAPRRKRPVAVPIDMPPQLLNRFTVEAFNTFYYHRILGKRSVQRLHYEPFFFPLDGIDHWNRLYGKDGFIQYQFVVPKTAGRQGIHAILTRIAASQRASFLAVLKVFGPANANLLSFPMEGYTLALDFKLTAGLFEVLDELDRMVLDYGGRLYLSKDCRMIEATFKRSYPRWEAFQAVRHRYGAVKQFRSLQCERLGL